MTSACAIAFFGGAAYEAGCVGWVHYAERARPGTYSAVALKRRLT